MNHHSIIVTHHYVKLSISSSSPETIATTQFGHTPHMNWSEEELYTLVTRVAKAKADHATLCVLETFKRKS